MVSRQTLHNRQQDVERLAAMVVASGVVGWLVTYDEPRGYVVLDQKRERIVAGRYEVVYNWLSGYRAGCAEVARRLMDGR